MKHLLLFLCVLFVTSARLAAQLSVATTPFTLLPLQPMAHFEVSATPTPPDLTDVFLGTTAGFRQMTTTAPYLLYQQHLAFFCRVEVKIDQAAKLPVRFRLGSVDYVDYLEGKRAYAPRQ